MTDSSRHERFRAVTPGLRRILLLVLVGFGLMSLDSIYLLGVRFFAEVAATPADTLISIWAFLIHVILGLLLVVPVVLYGFGHLLRARRSPNRNARRVGYVLFATSLILLLSGVLLLRVEGLFMPFSDGDSRALIWWAHVLAPLVVVWLFIAHRMVGPRLQWRVGIRWAGIGSAVLAVLFVFHSNGGEPVIRDLDTSGMSLTNARISGAESISVTDLTDVASCIACHPDVHASWSGSAHRFSSFDNPIYAATARDARSGGVHLSNFCAGCHDPVLLASGTLDDPRLDDATVDPTSIPGATAGVNCLVCHSIVDAEPSGNGSWTIHPPTRYPFHDSEWDGLKWVNRQLIRARPELHARTMLVPGVTDSAVFCGSCHKAWIPEDLNDYRWLAGQNHYDSWRLSGVSGHGLDSWRWPEHAITDCNVCHMPLQPSAGMAARIRDDSSVLKVHDHQFASGNTALMELLQLPDKAERLAASKAALAGSMRVDIIGLREGGVIDGPFIGPIRPENPTLVRGRPYLLEVVSRNLATGHAFTQGTADSNEIWLELTVRDGDRILAHSGLIDEAGVVDPDAYRLNSFVIDSEGHRVENRSAGRIFTKVYDHQVPPGAAAVTHYRLDVPEDLEGPLTIEVVMRYRKFDEQLMAFVYGPVDGRALVKTLPAVEITRDRVVLSIDGKTAVDSVSPLEAPAESWERLYDYGIGLFRTGKQGSFRQSENAFEMVEALGRLEGAYGLARVLERQGRLDEAIASLERASAPESTVMPWGVTYLSGQIDLKRGRFDSARERLEALAFEQPERFPGATARGFDFHGYDRLLLSLAGLELRLANPEEPELYEKALGMIEIVLKRNPESARAYWLRAQAQEGLGRSEDAAVSRDLNARYRIDEQAGEAAIRDARKRYPAADHAANPQAIYPLSSSEVDS